MRWVVTDGGRKAAGYKPGGDCVTRALAIVMRRPYGEVYCDMAEINAGERRTKRSVATTGDYTASHGIYTTRKAFKDYMARHGYVWTPTMSIGSGCKVHLRAEELPPGRLIVKVTRHYTAVIDGVLHDNVDVRRGGARCVYGYWKKA